MAAQQTQPTRGAHAPKARRQDARFPMGRRWRKATLIAHIVSAGAWLGIDVMVAVLVLTGRFGTTGEVRGLAYQALGTFVVWPMLGSGLICLSTGIVLGLGTRWGLVRYWWVAVKLVLNLVLCTLILVALRPGMGEVADYGRALSTGGDVTAPGAVSDMFFPPAVSLTALTFATVLAVAKPWGRVRRRTASKDAAR